MFKGNYNHNLSLCSQHKAIELQQQALSYQLMMLNSVSQIFTFASLPNSRKYQLKPKLPWKPNLIERKVFMSCIRDSSIFEGILDFLGIPIQNWALQYQKSLYNFALCEWIYNEIVSFSTSHKDKLSAGQKQDEVIRQLITQIRIQNSMTIPTFRKPRISLHNIFVLMTQYKVMQQIIYDLSTVQFEMMVDGLSYIYFHGVGKVQNIGEVLSEQEIISGVGGWGTIDQLTCCIHFITTHAKLYKTYPQKQRYSLIKQINILDMPNFIRVYDCLQANKKIDNIVNSIPMFMQFLQIFINHHNNSTAGYQFILNVKWLSGLGLRIMQIISYNINKILLVNNECSDKLSHEELQMVSQLQSLNQQNEKEESQIVLKLAKKAVLLRQTEGSINSRVLFSYAYHHLYTVNFMIKLTKKVLQLSKNHYKVYQQTCQNVCKFLHKLFECAYKYQFNLPQTSISQLCEIIKIISHEGQYVFGCQQRETRGFDFLYSTQINSPQLKLFIINLQRSDVFGRYLKDKHRSIVQTGDHVFGEEYAEDYNVMLQMNEDSMLYYVLSSIYNMKIDYLAIIYTILKYADKRTVKMLQYYFIKNQLLHFLIESQHQIQLKDKKNIKLTYNTIGCLIKGNLVSYAVLDQVIKLQLDKQKNQSLFIEDMKKNFNQTKQLLLTVLSDSITVNKQVPQSYQFCPQILKGLLYPSKQQLTSNPQSSNRHQVCISYISNVIIHELLSHKKKMQQIQKRRRKIQIPRYENLTQGSQQIQPLLAKHPSQDQIYSWITLILLLHIDYTQANIQGMITVILEYQDQELLLAQFVMTYLTTILSEAIKWKCRNQGERMVEFMRMLQDWQEYYTDLILSQQNNQDVVAKEYGGAIKFLFLKRWNNKIIRAIKLYLQSMQDYNQQKRQKRKNIQQIRNLKNIVFLK